ADDISGGAKAADMIPTILRIVFDGEHAGFFPKTAVTDRLDDLTEGQVVIGDMGGWSGRTRTSAAGVVVRQTNDQQIGKFALRLVLLEFFNELGSPEDIRHSEVPADGIGHEMRPQRLDRRFTPNVDSIGPVEKFPIDIK